MESRWRVVSPYSVFETVARLERVIGLNPAIRLVARIDQGPSVLQVLFENSGFARQIIEMDSEGAFDLPIKALVWEERTAKNCRVWLRTTDPRRMDLVAARKPGLVSEIEAILGAMIQRIIDPSDSLDG